MTDPPDEFDGTELGRTQAFGFTARRVLSDRELSTATRLLYAYLCTYLAPDRSAFPGVRRLADETGLSPTTVKVGIKALVVNGYLEHVPRKAKDGRDLSAILLVRDGIGAPPFRRGASERPPQEGSVSDPSRGSVSDPSGINERPPQGGSVSDPKTNQRKQTRAREPLGPADPGRHPVPCPTCRYPHRPEEGCHIWRGEAVNRNGAAAARAALHAAPEEKPG